MAGIKTWLGINTNYTYFPAKLYLLPKGEIEPQLITLKTPLESGKLDLVFVHPEPIFGSIFSKTSKGLVVFNGESFFQPGSLSTDAVGYKPEILSFDNRVFLQSNLGVFELYENLSVRQIESFPISEPWQHQVNIHYLDKSKTYIITNEKSGLVYTSKDLKHYTKIFSEGYILGTVSTTSNPETALLRGRQKIYAFSPDCQHIK